MNNTPETIPNTEAPTITPDAPELDYSYELEEGRLERLEKR